MSKPFALIIEDNPQLGTIFSFTLQTEFVTELIADGLLALERLAQVTPDLVVLDLHLPGMSGSQLLQYIRADERLAHTRVILATADAREAETLQDAADIVLLKPVSPIQLHTLATRFFAKPE